MNDRGLSRTLGLDRLHLTIATVVGILVAIVIGLYAVGMGGNPLKSLMLITGGSLLLLSTINPRLGLRLLILSGGYLDFLKRFLLLFGMGSFSDVLGVLAVSPITLTGVFLGACVLRPIFTKQMLDRQERRLAFLALVLIAAALVSAIRNSGGLSPVAFGNAANQAAYALLVPIVCVLYRRRGADELKRLLQFTIFVYLPVALYGIHQFVFGFTQFEMDYLRSGLTSMSALLYEEHPRPFSTLNSGHAFGVVMAILFVVSSVLCARSLRNRAGIFSSKWCWVLPAIFASACLIGFGRAAWLVAIISFVCIFAFRTRKRIVAFYTVFLLGFSVLVWKADVIYASLDRLQDMLPMDSSLKEQAFHIGTYSERLYGFQNMFRNRAMWTWFGNPALAYRAGEQQSEDEIVHDAIGQLLVSYGIAGLLMLAVGGGLSLFILHRRILAIRPGPGELLARGLLGTGIGVFFGGMLAGSHIAVFPTNLIFWTISGVLVAVVLMKAPLSVKKDPFVPAEPPRLDPGSYRPVTRTARATGFRPST